MIQMIHTYTNKRQYKITKKQLKGQRDRQIDRQTDRQVIKSGNLSLLHLRFFLYPI